MTPLAAHLVLLEPLAHRFAKAGRAAQAEIVSA
jgi:hypothetical protein